MKHIVFLFFALAILYSFPVKGQSDSLLFYESKVRDCTRMKNAGSVVITAGLVTAVVGTGMLVYNSNVEYDTKRLSQSEEASARLAQGVAFCAAGGTTTLIGIILTGIGSKRCKQYLSRIQNLSMEVIYTPGHRSLRLSYRF
jgi:hypothetical protein